MSAPLTMGPMRLHMNRAYRAVLLHTGIKPVVRVSSLTAQQTQREISAYQEMGFHAAAYHAGFRYDINDLYRFDDGAGAPLRFYIFVSRSRAHLDEILEANRLQKGNPNAESWNAATYTIGGLLGYPRCCTDFYNSFDDNPSQSSFLLRPYQASRDAMAPFSHPVFRLLGHFPCSLHCAQTATINARIVDAIARHMPDQIDQVRAELNTSTLLFDWNLFVLFHGNATRNAVRYTDFSIHGTNASSFILELRILLENGDFCLVDPPFLHIDRGATRVGSFDTRSLCVLPLFIPRNTEPIGKNPEQIAFTDFTNRTETRLRRMTQDHQNLGYRAEHLSVSAGSPPARVRQQLQRRKPTLVVTDQRVPAWFHRVLDADNIRHLDISKDGGRYRDRYQVAAAIEQLSRGVALDALPTAPAPASRVQELANRRLAGPCPRTRDLTTGRVHTFDTLPLRAEPDPFGEDSMEERLTFVHKQLRRHIIHFHGQRVTVSGRYLPLVAALLPTIDDTAFPNWTLEVQLEGDEQEALLQQCRVLADASCVQLVFTRSQPPTSRIQTQVTRVLRWMCQRVTHPAYTLDRIDIAGETIRATLRSPDRDAPLSLVLSPRAGDQPAFVRTRRFNIIPHAKPPLRPEEERWVVAFARLMQRHEAKNAR